MVRVELLVAFEDGLGQIAEGGAGGFLAAAFPTGAGAGLFFGAGGFEAGLVEVDAGVARSIDHEVERQAEGFVEVEGILPVDSRCAFVQLTIARLPDRASASIVQISRNSSPIKLSRFADRLERQQFRRAWN